MNKKNKPTPQKITKTTKLAKRTAPAKPVSKVSVGSVRKESRAQLFLHSLSGKLSIAAAIVVLAILGAYYVHAATNTYMLWDNNVVPQTISTGDTTAVTVGTTFESQYSGSVIGVRFYKSAQNTGAHVGSLWSATGQELASVTFANETSSGWQEADFAQPVDISANTPYVIAYYAPNGHYSQSKEYFTKDYVSGPLTAPASSNGLYLFAKGSAFPTKSRDGINYWVDVVFSTSKFSPSPSPAAPTGLAGSVANGVVTLNWKASTSTGVNSYTVLRNGSKIGSVNATSALQYQDTPAAGSTYTYKVEAVDQGGDISSPSNTVSITVPTSTIPTPPTPPSTPSPVPTPLGNNIVPVTTAAQLTAALASATPGETIQLADGTYIGNFAATASGTAAAPITLYGSSKAVLNGNKIGSGYVLHIQGGNYWQLVGFGVTNAQKGIVLDNSSHSVINGVTVFNTGDEGIHLRTGSSYDVVESSTVYSTGLSSANFGEGVYIGSAQHNWPLYVSATDQYGNQVDGSDYDEVLGNTIHNTGAENIDTKEGTTNGLIAGNNLSYSGSGSAAADLKGNNYTFENNTISNAPNNDHAAIEVWELVAGYGQNDVVTGNNIGSTGNALGIYVSQGTVNAQISCSNAVANPTAGLANVACK